MRIGLAHTESAIHRLACACQQKATSYRMLDARFSARRLLRCIHATDSSDASHIRYAEEVIAKRRMDAGLVAMEDSARAAAMSFSTLCVAMKRATSSASSNRTARSRRRVAGRHHTLVTHAMLSDAAIGYAACLLPRAPPSSCRTPHPRCQDQHVSWRQPHLRDTATPPRCPPQCPSWRQPLPSCWLRPASMTMAQCRATSWMPAFAGETRVAQAAMSRGRDNAAAPAKDSVRVATASPAAVPAASSPAMRKRLSRMKNRRGIAAAAAACGNPRGVSAAGRSARRARSPAPCSSPSAGSACCRCVARSRARPSRRYARSRRAA
jgi:hypothetical protein